MRVKLILASLAIALMQITPLNAQTMSPAGHYAKKSGGAGQMRVEQTREGWRVFISAGGIPSGGATAADCTLIAIGPIKNNIFQGEIKYNLDPSDAKPSPENAVLAGHEMSITFTPQFATVTVADVDEICGNGTGVFGRYTKGRK
jgi:hypothetical protein